MKPKVILDKYDLWFNNITSKWIHTKSFGDSADHRFGTDMGMTAEFSIEKETVEISCYAYGGMTGFLFEPSNVEKMNGNERECAEYVMKFINDLIQHNIISTF